MKLSNTKYKSQLQAGIVTIIIFMIALGIIGVVETNAIAQQTELLYEHPLRVRRAIGKIKEDIFLIHLDMHFSVLTGDQTEFADHVAEIDMHQADIFDQLEILSSYYLGPREDIDQIKQQFIKWDTIREETLRISRAGQKTEATVRIQLGGEEDKQTTLILAKLEQISVFASEKADELFANSQQLNKDLHTSFYAILATVVLLALIIYFLLLRNLRRPLDELARASRDFINGNLDARSAYTLENEFGDVSEQFNEMAEKIQGNLELNKKRSTFADLMLSENDTKQFFKVILTEFSEQTHSQIAAVYLLSQDRKTFEHFESIGLNGSAKKSFAADTFEGEFGKALATRKIQHMNRISKDSHFSFHAVSGKFIPREIITVPVISDHQITAVLSLATISSYDQRSIQFVNEIWKMLNARVVGILAYRQVQKQAEILDQQNRELDTQKNELTVQSSELNQQNRELEMQKTQLSEASRLKTSFISNMSHELRTPLNSVIALSGVLGRRLANTIPEEEYSYLEVIERNGKQLLELINDILDLSRIEAGREEVEISRFVLDDLVAEIQAVIKPLAQQKNVEFLVHSSPKLPLIVSDYEKCRHILQNLVGNAVKFTETGRVEINSYQKKETFQIAVSDTGIGISESDQNHIFDEFRQADGSTSRKYGGTGLGLAIAKKFAALIGGSITVESTLGEGSVFTLSLPMRIDGDDVKIKNKAVKPAVPVSTSKRAQTTLLLVEDSEPAIIQMKDILEESAYHLLVARNGKEALETIAQTRPDAIILDLMMPEVDGFEVLKAIRANDATAHLPVLILTAKYATKKELQFLKHNNVYQLIQKGAINRSELLSAIDGMVAKVKEQVEKPRPRRSRKTADKAVVLVVEDNPDNMLTTKALLGHDFTIIEAENGELGIEKAREFVPDLILMDIALPGIDGIQALKTIKNEAKLQKVKVIALTASAMSSDREAILAHGFDGYIAKPIKEDEFMHTIQKVLDGRN